jgi:hypothetical protein
MLDDGAFRVALDLVYPPQANGFVARWERRKLPGVVLDDGGHLLVHGLPPCSIGDRRGDVPWFFRREHAQLLVGWLRRGVALCCVVHA